jgi:hypothetical protein
MISRFGSRIILKRSLRAFSTENITYSGGQASKGQGGYYGSGGSRKIDASAAVSTESQRSKLLAVASDVEYISNVMDKVLELEGLLQDEQKQNKEVSNRSIELKSKMQQLVGTPEFLQCLDRLEIQGAPIWGLTTQEHELLKAAREKVNNC